VRRRRAPGTRADRVRSRPVDLGQRLSAPLVRRQGGIDRAVESARHLGARRGDPQADPGREPRKAVRLLLAVARPECPVHHVHRAGAQRPALEERTMTRTAWLRCALLVPLLYAPLAVAAEPPKLDAANTAWMLTASLLVLFMTLPGLALFYAGLVRSRNVLSV